MSPAVECTIPSILFAILIPLVCFTAVLLLLRFSAKASWLTSIAASVVVTTIPAIFGIRMLSAPGVQAGSRVGETSPHVLEGPAIGWLFLLPAVICAVILVVQFLRWLLVASDNAAVNTAERSRILKMVEDGKISSEEGAELLDAMGRSNALRGQGAFSRLDFAMLCGVALVILGFFLPWAYITLPGLGASGTFSGGSAYQAGYHVGAIGWAVLVIAVVSAIPIFVTPKDLLYKISMLQVFLTLVGGVLVVSVLVRVGGHLGVGLIFCLAGFIVELVGSAVKLKSLAA
jgi:hypothetical protein